MWRGVGGIAAITLPRHDGVDRWALGLHQVHLHGGGVGPQHHGLGLPELEVQRVPHAPGGVGGRHVQRLEVVPIGLGLGALGHHEPHPHEDVLELVARALDHVQAPAWAGGDDLGQVQTIGVEPSRTLALLELDPLVGQVRLDRAAGLVETASRLGTFPRIEGDEALVGSGQRGALAQELGLQLVQRRQRGDRRQLAQGQRHEHIGIGTVRRRSLAPRRRGHRASSMACRLERRRAASKHKTAAAVDTLSDSAPPPMGMVTRASRRSSSCAGRPLASLPSTKAKGDVRSTSV